MRRYIFTMLFLVGCCQSWGDAVIAATPIEPSTGGDPYVEGKIVAVIPGEAKIDLEVGTGRLDLETVTAAPILSVEEESRSVYNELLQNPGKSPNGKRLVVCKTEGTRVTTVNAVAKVEVIYANKSKEKFGTIELLAPSFRQAIIDEQKTGQVLIGSHPECIQSLLLLPELTEAQKSGPVVSMVISMGLLRGESANQDLTQFKWDYLKPLLKAINVYGYSPKKPQVDELTKQFNQLGIVIGQFVWYWGHENTRLYSSIGYNDLKLNENRNYTCDTIEEAFKRGIRELIDSSTERKHKIDEKHAKEFEEAFSKGLSAGGRSMSSLAQKSATAAVKGVRSAIGSVLTAPKTLVANARRITV